MEPRDSRRQCTSGGWAVAAARDERVPPSRATVADVVCGCSLCCLCFLRSWGIPPNATLVFDVAIISIGQ